MYMNIILYFNKYISYIVRVQLKTNLVDLNFLKVDHV